MKMKKNGGLNKLVDLFIEKKEEEPMKAEILSDEEMLEKLKTDPNAIYALSVDQMCRESFLLKAIDIRPELINIVLEEQSVDFSFVYKAIEHKFEILEVINPKYFSDINFMSKVTLIDPRLIECADDKIVSNEDKMAVLDFCEGNTTFQQTIKKVNLLNIAVSSAVIQEAENKVRYQFNEICEQKKLKYRDTLPREFEDALKYKLNDVWVVFEKERNAQFNQTVKTIKEINI